MDEIWFKLQQLLQIQRRETGPLQSMISGREGLKLFKGGLNQRELKF